MNFEKISKLIDDKITGEWGTEAFNGNGTNVLRTTNFTNVGIIDYSEVVQRNIDRSIVKRKKLEYGDIILEKSGGGPKQPVGRVVFFDREDNKIFLCNNFTTLLRPSPKVEPKYLFYALFYNYLIKKTLKFQNKTTGIINLQLDRYLEEKIYFPNNKKKQIEIVNVLDKADAIRKKRREAIRLADEFLRSTFLEMFGDPYLNPKGWEKVPFSKIAYIDRAIIDPTNLRMSTNYIGLEDIESHTGKILRINKINSGELKSTKFAFSSNHILFGKLRPYLNKVANPNFQGICSTDILPILPIKNKSNRPFLTHLMRHQAFVSFASEKSSGANLPRISPRIIEGYETIAPDIKLQNKFAEIVEKTEKLKQKYEQSLQEAENLFNSLMQRAFRGEI